MADFDFANDIADVLNTVADKVKEYGGYAKLNALIKAEQAKKQEQYYRLGKKYYELYKDAPASDLTDITDKIVACEEKIAAYREELKAAKEAGYTDVNEEASDEDEDVNIGDIAETVEKEADEADEADEAVEAEEEKTASEDTQA